jgi:tagatose 1,6-diphosphate aldolase
MGFTFLDPGPLIDRELELVPPRVELIDDVLSACAHPLTVRDAPAEASVTRKRLMDFCSLAPNGRQNADRARGWVPAYHFWMRLSQPVASPPSAAGPIPKNFYPITIAGGLGVRVGATREIELYSGNVGYHVYPAARGRHYAERSVRLVLPLLKRHGFSHIWITTNPDNIASRRTCERLGARLIEIVQIPRDHPFRARSGETEKCRYLLHLP